MFYCRPIQVMCYSFVKMRSEVWTESILKKQHLQNRCRRHIGGGQKVYGLWSITQTFTPKSKLPLQVQLPHNKQHLPKKRQRLDDEDFSVHAVRKIYITRQSASLAAFLFPFGRTTAARCKTHSVGYVCLHQSRLLVFLCLQHQPRDCRKHLHQIDGKPYTSHSSSSVEA